MQESERKKKKNKKTDQKLKQNLPKKKHPCCDVQNPQNPRKEFRSEEILNVVRENFTYHTSITPEPGILEKEEGDREGERVTR